MEKTNNPHQKQTTTITTKKTQQKTNTNNPQPFRQHFESNFMIDFKGLHQAQVTFAGTAGQFQKDKHFQEVEHLYTCKYTQT